MLGTIIVVKIAALIKDAIRCRLKGYTATVCPGSKSSGLEQTGSTNRANWCETSNDWKMETDEQDLHTWMLEAGNQQVLVLGKPAGRSPLTVTVKIDGKPLSLEADTGASVSVMSYQMWARNWAEFSLQKCYVVLRTYSNEQLTVHGLIILP